VAYLTIAPAGAFLSLDRMLFGKEKKSGLFSAMAGPAEPSVTANIALRLIQVHVAMFYVMMGLSKLYGDAWWQGSAVWVLFAQTESRGFDISGLRRLGAIGEYMLNFVTHLIVYFELAFPVLIWTRVGRSIVLALSVLVWAAIILATGHVLFGLAMLACNVAFMDPRKLRASLGIDTVSETTRSVSPVLAS